MLEFLGMGVLSFVAAGAVTFLVLMRTSQDVLSLLFSNPLLYLTVCLLPTLMMLIMVYLKQKRTYIVGFEFLDSSMNLIVRKNSSSSIQVLNFFNTEIFAETIKERGFIFISRKEGIRFVVNGDKYDFITNNFLWEENHNVKKLFKKMVLEKRLHETTTSSLILDEK
jgi:hypothetical protein